MPSNHKTKHILNKKFDKYVETSSCPPVFHSNGLPMANKSSKWLTDSRQRGPLAHAEDTWLSRFGIFHILDFTILTTCGIRDKHRNIYQYCVCILNRSYDLQQRANGITITNMICNTLHYVHILHKIQE